MSVDTERGLYHKYNVTKADTGEEVRDCIVLRPDRDNAAWSALDLYADLVEPVYPDFAADLRVWLYRMGRPFPGKESY